MKTLTPKEIQRMTGMPKSTLARHLVRFPAARVGHGQYDPTEPQFGAWLTLYSLSDKPHGSHGSHGSHETPEPPELPQAPQRAPYRGPRLLPSGLLLAERSWAILRGPDEGAAMAHLATLIRRWRLTPHPDVPDLMGFERLELAPGIVVNRTQWRALRGQREEPAAHALDVLLRSWGALP